MDPASTQCEWAALSNGAAWARSVIEASLILGRATHVLGIVVVNLRGALGKTHYLVLLLAYVGPQATHITGYCSWFMCLRQQVAGYCCWSMWGLDIALSCLFLVTVGISHKKHHTNTMQCHLVSNRENKKKLWAYCPKVTEHQVSLKQP
jgi:hypothetical protein